jgi:flagellar biosynthetic protein FlhB
MAEEDTGQEKTEEATPRRLERAREEGQVPRSRELSTAAILLAGSVSLVVFGNALGSGLLGIGRDALRFDRRAIRDPDAMLLQLGSASSEALLLMAPVFILLLLAAVLGPASLGGWLFSTRALAPKLERLDPLRGLQRMFSLRSLVELLKAIAKVLLVGAVTMGLLWALRGELAAMAMQPLEPAIRHAVTMLGWSALVLSASTLLIAALDVPFQLFDHAQKLRMSMQQVRDELKESEGRPEVKSRIRQLQRQFARSRMMAAVPKADVVITNPTHYAVALRYDAGRAAAPMLLAKGSDLLALKIREIAEAHGVPVVSSPRLARAIWFTTEIEAQIPAGLYLAVAQVLAYVFHLRNHRRGRGSAPVLPEELPIPEGMDVPGGAARDG